MNRTRRTILLSSALLLLSILLVLFFTGRGQSFLSMFSDDSTDTNSVGDIQRVKDKDETADNSTTRESVRINQEPKKHPQKEKYSSKLIERLAILQSKTDGVYAKYAPVVYEKLVMTTKRNYQWEELEKEKLHKLLADEKLKDTSMREVHCGDAICKVAVTHKNAGAASEFIKRALGNKNGWDTEVYFNSKNLDSGEKQTNVYFSEKVGDIQFHLRAREELLGFI